MTMWCERCGLNVTKEYIEEGCAYWECPMENRQVDVGDDLHRVLGEALAHKPTPEPSR